MAVSPDVAYLDSILSEDEQRDLEFKTAERSFSTDKALAYFTGIANSGGGILVLGVSDDREVVGTSAFSDVREIELRAHERLGIIVVAREIDYNGLRVILFQIPPRRRGTPIAFDGRFYLRTGESLVAMTPHQLSVIFQEGQPRPSLNVVRDSLSADVVERLLDIDVFFSLLSLPRPSSPTDAIEALCAKDLVIQTGPDVYSITLIGALFLSRDLSFFRGLEWRRVRIIKYSGRDRVHAVEESFEARGYGLSFEDILLRVQTQAGLTEVIEGGRREYVPSYPPTALREFVANALVHQDLTDDGVQITVEVFEDRIEIRNPGVPLIEVTRFVDESRSRNPELAEIMRLARICEVRGSGVDRALTQIESLARPAPDFRTESGATSVILYLERTFDDMTIDERAWAAFLHCCIRYVAGDGLTNSSLRDRFGLPATKAAIVSQTIAAAIDRGFIKLDPRVGSSKRHARYQPFFG